MNYYKIMLNRNKKDQLCDNWPYIRIEKMDAQSISNIILFIQKYSVVLKHLLSPVHPLCRIQQRKPFESGLKETNQNH